jgi:hypothetical protein
MAEASLIIPDLPKFSVEEQSGMSMGSSSGSSDTSDCRHETPSRNVRWNFVNNVVWGPSGSSTGTSSSSSGPTSHGGNSHGFLGMANFQIADPLLAEWLRDGTRLEIALPPANPLLRPPQV